MSFAVAVGLVHHAHAAGHWVQLGNADVPGGATGDHPLPVEVAAVPWVGRQQVPRVESVFAAALKQETTVSALFERSFRCVSVSCIAPSSFFKEVMCCTHESGLPAEEHVAASPSYLTTADGQLPLSTTVMLLAGLSSRRREFCHSADALSPSLLKHLRKAEGGATEGQPRRRLTASGE